MKHKGNSQFWKQVESGQWEPETFKILDRFCKPNKTFIDIGAWNGVCSLYASEKGTYCYAIEPDPKALKLLTKNVQLNKADIDIHPICISNINGEISLNTQYDSGFGNSMSSILDRGLVVDSVKVKSMTLEKFIELNGINIDNVCLIKIDIEGGEVALINQAKEFLSKYKPTIYLSLHPVWFPNGDADTNSIAEAIFSIYKVYDVTNRQYELYEFLGAVNSGVHSFVLEA